MGSVIDVKDQDFDQQVLKSGMPVVVDFWAPWCPPCSKISAMMDKLSVEYKDRLKSYKSRGGAGTSTEILRGGVGVVNPQIAGLLCMLSASSLRISRSRSASTTFLPRQFGQVMNPLPSLQSWH